MFGTQVLRFDIMYDNKYFKTMEYMYRGREIDTNDIFAFVEFRYPWLKRKDYKIKFCK